MCKIAHITPNEILQNLSQNHHATPPRYLLKFYSPKSYNFDAVENGKVFLSSPAHFNDSYDCKLTYNQEDVIKRYILEWMWSIYRNIDINEVRLDSFDRNDLIKLYDTKDTSPIEHRDDYSETFTEMFSSILLKKNYEFRISVETKTSFLLKSTDQIIRQIDNAANIGVSCFCN